MKNDDSHGPTQTYPDDWDPGEGQRTGSAEGSTESDPGRTVEGLEESDEEPENELQADATALALGDDARDAREYECGECGADVPYLSDCPNCENPLQWQGVSA